MQRQRDLAERALPLPSFVLAWLFVCLLPCCVILPVLPRLHWTTIIERGLIPSRLSQSQRLQQPCHQLIRDLTNTACGGEKVYGHQEPSTSAVDRSPRVLGSELRHGQEYSAILGWFLVEEGHLQAWHFLCQANRRRAHGRNSSLASGSAEGPPQVRRHIWCVSCGPRVNAWSFPCPDSVNTCVRMQSVHLYHT